MGFTLQKRFLPMFLVVCAACTTGPCPDPCGPTCPPLLESSGRAHSLFRRLGVGGPSE